MSKREAVEIFVKCWESGESAWLARGERLCRVRGFSRGSTVRAREEAKQRISKVRVAEDPIFARSREAKQALREVFALQHRYLGGTR